MYVTFNKVGSSDDDEEEDEEESDEDAGAPLTVTSNATTANRVQISMCIGSVWGDRKASLRPLIIHIVGHRRG